MRPTVSVIIPHLNQLDHAERCFAALAAQSYPADRIQIIMVDNGSSVDLSGLKSRHPSVLFLAEPAPGPGLARNRGIASATGEILAFIDADCRAHPDWLDAAVDALHQPGATGVVGGDVRIDFVDVQHPTAMEAYEAVFAFRQSLYINQHRYSGTGNLAMRPDIHRSVGPFGGIEIAEDRDWGERAHAAGYPVRYCPEMVVYHPARRDFDELRRKWRRHIAHQLADHRGHGRSGLRWTLNAVAVALSAFAHIPKMLASDRISGVANRLRGMAILFRIRWYRAGEMLAQARTRESAAADWNQVKS